MFIEFLVGLLVCFLTLLILSRLVPKSALSKLQIPFTTGCVGQIPPGPPGWPLVGNLPQLDRRGVYYSTTKWSKEWGDVYSVWFGQQLVVVLASGASLQEAFVKQGAVFMDKVHQYYIPKTIFRDKGLIFQPFGPTCKELRKLCLVTMRELGVGKSSLEERIFEEIQILSTHLESNLGEPVSIRRPVQNAMANVVCSISFGKKFDHEDPYFQTMLDRINTFWGFNIVPNPLNFFPILRLLPSYRHTIPQMENALKLAKEIFHSELEEHKRTFDADNPRDFIDVFLQEQKKCEEEGEKESSYNDDEHISQMIVDLFLAGSETAAASITWTCLLLIRYPEVQEKCRRQILEVVGTSRHSTMRDKVSLPYIEATINEVLRYITVAPLAAAHQARWDTTIRGYVIPKGTMMVADLYAIHHDERYWDQPDQFNPERWIDSSDGSLRRHDNFYPFSAGLRHCPGAQLVQMELFLFVTYFFSRYRLHSGEPDGSLPSDDHYKAGVVRQPKPFNLRLSML